MSENMGIELDIEDDIKTSDEVDAVENATRKTKEVDSEEVTEEEKTESEEVTEEVTEEEKTESSDIEVEKLKKQVKDLTAKLSKNSKAPKDIKEYDNAYVVDSKYENYFNSEDGKNTLKDLKEFAKNNGLSLDQYKNLVDNTLNTLIKKGVIDTRSENEIKAQQQLWVQKQKEILGDNADHIIKTQVDFIKTTPNFSKEEKMQLLNLVNGGVIGISIVNKLRNYIEYDRYESTEIPTNINTGVDADVATLVKQYKKEVDNDNAAELFNKILTLNKGELPKELTTM
jgi:hypothetical protein